jgi:hypothetical protein
VTAEAGQRENSLPRRGTQHPVERPGGPRSIWAPRRVREVGAQFPDRQGRVSPSQAKLNKICPEPFASRLDPGYMNSLATADRLWEKEFENNRATATFAC